MTEHVNRPAPPYAASIEAMLAAARAEGARDMRTKIETLIAKAESGADAWGACAHEWARIADLRALLADGGEPQPADCNCGWGGVHDPDNPRCQANAVGGEPQ